MLPHLSEPGTLPLDRPAGTSGRLSPRGNDRVPQGLKLRSLLASVAGPAEEAYFALGGLLSLTDPSLRGEQRSSAQRRKAEIFAAILAQLHGLAAARHPVLLVFEDAHWSDPTSLELLERHDRRQPGRARFGRRHLSTEAVLSWHGHPHVTALAVGRLSRRQNAALVGHILGDVDLPPRVRRRSSPRRTVSRYSSRNSPGRCCNRTAVAAAAHSPGAGDRPPIEIPEDVDRVPDGPGRGYLDREGRPPRSARSWGVNSTKASRPCRAAGRLAPRWNSRSACRGWAATATRDRTGYHLRFPARARPRHRL